ncbi:Chromosome segregation ATPase [Dethiosulfatibacter aminovorans DSM 17477]|uniref:Chromosome segregation ATPase n=1 Tax=Dethiosulfatibacter aminovorans DSM 17477 TaxID=1121476 RepID=A0A1M6LC62_9FIRM|nr:hypothetical protein [Dethiosulfatibacter aminovorans]SHJ68821.1 Chromosome segregation ATPase [Dethiosulfatibacter aminovorans DSM 17477]
MPKINRLRITNFSYNNNRRHIIDETFDFYNGENALLSLANGGGKSVLVQTILQPIVPKTKLLGRPISDFFIGKKDPAYIMIEWLLDDGAGYLLTGIGISPTMNYNPNAEEDNLNLRFYTFSHHYEEGNKYDIKNIPITEVKNNGIVVAGYNDIKKLLKSEENKGNYDINYYNSTKDEQVTYERRLNMYSISRNEWKELMVSINQAEHGVSEVFAKCKSSRQVMEQWVIKYIEKVLDKSTEDKMSDHQKLEEMMVQVASSEVENESFIQEYDEIEKFKYDLTKIDEASKEICGLLDDEDKKKKELVGIYHFFSNKMEKMIADEEQMKGEVEVKEREIQHIDLEEKSYEIHKIDNEKDELTERLGQIREELGKVNTAIEQQQNELKLQQGAREYEVIKEKMKEEAEQKKLLDNATKNQEDLLKEMSQIEYSLKCLYSKQIESLREEINKNEDELKKSKAKKTEISEQVNIKNKEVNRLSTRKGGLEAKTEDFLKYESKLLEELGISLPRNPLLGELNQEDINEVINVYDTKLEDLDLEHERVKKNISECDDQIKTENKRLSDMDQKIREEENEQFSNKNAIAQYEDEKSKVIKIISRYCNNQFSVFDKEVIVAYLRNSYEEWTRKAVTTDMEINELSKMINGIKEGISYLPATLINTLQDNNFAVYTGEQYLRELSRANREKIILKNPLLPYGLIATEKEREIIAELVEDIDLSQLVPLFSHADKEMTIEDNDRQILSNPSLLKYDNDGMDTHIQKIEKQIDVLNNEKKEALEVAEQYINALKVVNDFKWSLEDEKDFYKNRNEISNRLGKMTAEHSELLESIEQLNKQLRNYEDKCRELLEDKKKCLKNSGLFKDYLDKDNDYCLKNKELLKIVTVIEKLNKEITNLSNDAERLGNSIENSKFDQSLKVEKLNRIEDKYDLYKEAADEIIIDATLEELEGMLEACKKNVSDDVTVIEARLKGTIKDIGRSTDNIRRLGLNLEDVQTVVYSARIEEELQDEINRYNELREKHDKDERNTENKIIRLDEARKIKVKSLNGNHILDRSEIKGDFKNRLEKIRTSIRSLRDKINRLTNQKNLLNILNTRIESKIESVAQLQYEQDVEIEINEKTEGRVKELIEQFGDSIKNSGVSISAFDKICKAVKSAYANTVSNTVEEAIKGIYSQIDNLTRNYEKYYYLTERISFYDELLNSTLKLMQSKIDQLKHSKNDLIEHAYMEAKNVYDEIPKVVDNSSIEFDGVKRKILDIQYDKIQSDEIAKEKIKDHILICLENITNEIKKNEEEIRIRKNINKVLSTKELLNVISNLENFKVKAYKVDIYEKNRHMMSWEDLIVKNSGGEKFVAYFSLLVALISYSRKNTQAVDLFKKKEESKVLIMDNPFGPITSGHLLKPMFDIANKYDTQLICLSDIKEGAVINSFNLVYSIKIRQNMMRQEYLDIEENNFAGLKVDEKLEKAYLYSRASQISLLDE